MNRINLKKASILFVMVILLALTPVSSFQVWANAADQKPEYTLKLEIPQDSIYFEDAKRPDISVKVYQVAAIAEDEAYLFRNEIDDMTEQMLNSAKPDLEKAAEIISDQLKSKTADHTVCIKSGTGTVTGIDPGLYLIAADPAKNENYEYRFQPYLIKVSENSICDLKIGRTGVATNIETAHAASINSVFCGTRPVKTQDDLMELFSISQGALICGTVCVGIAWKKHKKI